MTPHPAIARVPLLVPSDAWRRDLDATKAEIEALVKRDQAPSDAELKRLLDRVHTPSRKAEKRPTRAAEILARWEAEGPLVHEPTGLASLDEFTGGGPVYGTRWYLLGAPDAGKTALLAQIADVYAERGLLVGMLAVDEEDGDLFTRFLQRRGIRRAECEARTANDLRDMRFMVTDALSSVRFYSEEWAIEEAAEDLAAAAREAGKRAFLAVDSLQTVRGADEAELDSTRTVVTARVRAIREMATKHGLIVIATSEMTRSAYRNATSEVDDMAAAKESGAVEYSARVMLALRSIKGEADLLELRIAKNKHGPSAERIGLRIDRLTQTLTEAELPEETETLEEQRAERDEARKSAERRKNLGVALEMARIVASCNGDLSIRDLGPMLRTRLHSCSAPRVETARAILGEALVKPGGPRSHQGLYLDGSKLTDELLSLVELAERAALAGSRPPAEVAK